MNLQDKLKEAGYKIPNKINKLEAKEKNLQLRIERASAHVNDLERQLNKYSLNKDPDLACALSFRFNTFVEAFKDIINEISKLENTREIGSYRAAIRRFGVILGHSHRDIENALGKFENRNSIIHEYLDEAYYFEQLYNALSNDIDKYKQVMEILHTYCVDKGYIK